MLTETIAFHLLCVMPLPPWPCGLAGFLFLFQNELHHTDIIKLSLDETTTPKEEADGSQLVTYGMYSHVTFNKIFLLKDLLQFCVKLMCCATCFTSFS